MDIKGNKLIFKSLVGSHSYGTNIEGSDLDYKGVYIQDPKDVLENGYREQIEVSKDEVYFELGRFLQLCQGGNPTMLKLLFAPKDCIEVMDPLFSKVVENKHKFLSRQCRHSFGGYAISQIKKAGGLDKKMNWEKERVVRKSVLDFCWVYEFENKGAYRSDAQQLIKYLDEKSLQENNCGLVKIDHMRDSYLLFCSDPEQSTATNIGPLQPELKGIAKENANELCLSEVPADALPKGILYFNKDAYSIHCKEFSEYEAWLKHRNTQRYVDVAGHGQQIDGKNLLHCVRLIETALEIAKEETLNVRRPNADYLIEIRKGKHNLSVILSHCEEMIEAMDQVFVASGLPEKVDEAFVKELERGVRREYYASASKR